MVWHNTKGKSLIKKETDFIDVMDQTADRKRKVLNV
jgi:hypothetical protein